MKQFFTNKMFAIAAVTLSLAAFANTHASTITVTSLADSGPGSLRQAITNSASGDTIVFDVILNFKTITLTSGELLIDHNLTITGFGAANLALSGNDTARVIRVIGSSTVTITALTITAGNANTENGGGILAESGSTLNLTDCALTGNTAANGGALSNDGVVKIKYGKN